MCQLAKLRMSRLSGVVEILRDANAVVVEPWNRVANALGDYTAAHSLFDEFK
jgi:hypothetical protein